MIAKYKVFTIFSILCPFVGFAVVLGYLEFANAEYWAINENIADDSARLSGALMGFSEVILLILGTFIGCVFGVVLGVVSLVIKKSWIGIAVVIFNLSPFLILVFRLSF